MSDLKVTRMGEEEEVFLNIMVYGEPDTGKTSFAATACDHPQMSEVLFLAIEGGMLTVREMGLSKPPLVAEISKANEVEDVFWKLAGKAKPWDKIKTVVIDSATELVQMDLEETVARALPKPSRKGVFRNSVDDAWLEDRGEVSQRNARILRWFRDLPVHVIYVAHPRFEFPRNADGMPDRTGNPTEVRPGFGPRLCQQVCGYMDFVWYLVRSGDDTVKILTNSRGPYFAKTRGERLRQRFSPVIEWHPGDAILPAVFETVLNDKPFPFSANQEDSNK